MAGPAHGGESGHHRHGPKNGPACAGIGERQTGPELEARHNGKSLPGRGATVPAQPPRTRSLLPEGGARATGLMMKPGGLNFSIPPPRNRVCKPLSALSPQMEAEAAQGAGAGGSIGVKYNLSKVLAALLAIIWVARNKAAPLLWLPMLLVLRSPDRRGAGRAEGHLRLRPGAQKRAFGLGRYQTARRDWSAS
jgi:hypothetical protein